MLKSRMKEKGLFDEEDRLRVLSKLGDSLEKLNEKINWEIFKPILKKALNKEAKGLGGRPAYDYVLMFKIIILQRLYNISDDQTEYQINDRVSFMRFLGLELKDKVPDAKTIWLFKEKLIEARVSKKLFEKLQKEVQDVYCRPQISKQDMTEIIESVVMGDDINNDLYL